MPFAIELPVVATGRPRRVPTLSADRDAGFCSVRITQDSGNAHRTGTEMSAPESPVTVSNVECCDAKKLIAGV